MITVFGNKQLGFPYGYLINRLLSRLEVPIFEDDEYATPIKHFTKKTISHNRTHVKEESSRAGPSTGAEDILAEEAEIDVATSGAEEVDDHPRTFRGQLCRFELSATQRLDHLDAHLDAFHGRLGHLEQSVAQTILQLAQIIFLLQLQ